jgi:hypothetical protein
MQKMLGSEEMQEEDEESKVDVYHINERSNFIWIGLRGLRLCNCQ